MQIVTVCRSGGEYTPAHANTLARQVWHHCGMRLTVLTDADPAAFSDQVEVVRMRTTWPGWWAKIELFDQFRDATLYVDLDTVIVGDCRHIRSSGPLMMLADIYRRGSCGSGVMTWAQDYSHLARDFMRRADQVMRDYQTRNKWGDQGYIEAMLGKGHANRIQELWPRQVISYKAEALRKGTKGAKIVYFHGKPRPWDVDLMSLGIDDMRSHDAVPQDER
jgi:hypothetical protein